MKLCALRMPQFGLDISAAKCTRDNSITPMIHTTTNLTMPSCCCFQVPFAHDVVPADDLLSAVQQLRPSILIGVSTVANAFTQEVVEAMAEINTRPLIFPLSNPTSKSECTFEQAVSGIANMADCCMWREVLIPCVPA